MSDESDEALVELAAAGDRRAFARLLDRHYVTIYRLAYRICRDRSDAEDVAQSVCVKLGRSIRGFAGRSAFSSWLYSVTLNTARDLRRAQARRQAQAQKMLAAPAEPAPPGQEQGVLSAQVWSRIEALPERQRSALILVYGEDLDHRQAAEVLGCAVGTVGWLLHQAIARLKDEMHA